MYPATNSDVVFVFVLKHCYVVVSKSRDLKTLTTRQQQEQHQPSLSHPSSSAQCLFNPHCIVLMITRVLCFIPHTLHDDLSSLVNLNDLDQPCPLRRVTPGMSTMLSLQLMSIPDSSLTHWNLAASRLALVAAAREPNYALSQDVSITISYSQAKRNRIPHDKSMSLGDLLEPVRSTEQTISLQWNHKRIFRIYRVLYSARALYVRIFRISTPQIADILWKVLFHPRSTGNILPYLFGGWCV